MCSITNCCRKSIQKPEYNEVYEDEDSNTKVQYFYIFGKDYEPNDLDTIEDRISMWLCYLRSSIISWTLPKIQGKLSLEYYRLSRGNNVKIYEAFISCIDELKCTTLFDYDEIVPQLFQPLNTFVEPTSMLKPDSKQYQIFHGYLEARIYHLKALKIMENQKKINPTISYKEEYQLLLFDLIKVCQEKYLMKRYTPEMMLGDTPFFCSCIENAFVQLFKMDSPELFYEALKKNTDVMMKNNDLYDQIATSRRLINKPDNITPYGFHFWIFCETLKLLKQRQINSFSEISSYDSLKEMWEEFKKIDQSEDNLRFFMFYALPIVTRYWEFDINIVLMFWEHFKKRLNEKYFIISEKSPSPVEFSMKSTYYRSDLAHEQCFKFKETNSFELFLYILSYSISSLFDTDQNAKIKKIFARIFSTFPNTPEGSLATLTSNGVYNLALLLMTMVESCPSQDDYPKISQCMTNLVNLQFSKLRGFSIDVVVERIQMMTLGNMALFIQLQYREFNFGSYVSRFLTLLDGNYKKMYGAVRLLSCYDIVATTMHHVFRIRRDFSLGEEFFIDQWLSEWTTKSNEREKILKLTCSLIKNGKYVTKITEYLFKPIKELYPEIKSDYVAEMAGHFCVNTLATKSKNEFVIIFNFYESSETASIDSKLTLFSTILDSGKVTTADIGENVLIRNWIKFAVLKNPEIIFKMTELVCECDKFRAVCDLPTFDVTTADDPIALLLKSIGDKFKSFKENDFHNKAAYFRIVHEFFLSVHTWVKDPDPETLKKIFRFLANALKDCGRAVYSRMTNNCLFISAFKAYFLPNSVIQDGNSFTKSSIEAMVKVWHLVMESIGQLEYQTENSLINYLNNMITKWIPAFDKLESLTERSRPFEALLYIENEEFIRIVYKKICINFVELQKNYIPKNNAIVVLRIFKQILNNLIASEKDNSLCFFLNMNAVQIYTHAISANNGNQSKVEAMKCISVILDYFFECQSDVVRTEIKGTFKEIAFKFITSDNDANLFFKFMEKIAQKHTQFAKMTLQIIKFAVSDAEMIFNLGSKNTQLRTSLSTYEGALTSFEERGNRIQIDNFS